MRPVLRLAVQRRVSARRALGQSRVSVSLGSRREVRGRWARLSESSLYSLWLARGARTEVRGRSTHGLSPAFKVEDCTQTFAAEAGGRVMHTILGC